MESPLQELGVFWNRFRVHYRHHVVQPGKESSFWIAFTFLLTFGLVRLITLRIRREHLAGQQEGQLARQRHSRFGFHDIVLPGGLHLHHAVPGIFLALTSGYLGLVREKRATRPLSVLYGMGSALALDEFALWLELQDVYWSKDGRRSVEAVAVAGSLFLGGFALSEFGGALLRDIRVRARTGRYPPHHPEPDEQKPAPDESGKGSGDVSAPHEGVLRRS